MTLAQDRATIEAMPNGTENLSIYSDNDIETYRDVLFYVGQAEERDRMDLVGFCPEDLRMTAGGD